MDISISRGNVERPYQSSALSVNYYTFEVNCVVACPSIQTR